MPRPKPCICHRHGDGQRRATATGMILLISSLDKTEDLAQALQETTSQGVQVCTGFTLAIAHLQAREFSAVVLDQLLLDADPGGSETACKHFGSAVPVYV